MDLCVLLSRLLLVVGCLIAPWFLGGYLGWTRGLIYIPVAASAVFAIPYFFSPDNVRSRPERHLTFACIAMLIYVGIQSLTQTSNPLGLLRSAIIAPTAFFEGQPSYALFPTSVSAPHTQSQWCVLAICISAFVVSTKIWADERLAKFVLILISLNGVALSIVGMIGMLGTENYLDWLEYGKRSNSFASFVNRNNAASYLLLCMAACLAWKDLSDGDSARYKAPRIADIVFGILIAGVIATQSRGGILAMLVGLAVWLAAKGEFAQNLRSLTVPTLVGVGLASVGVLQTALTRYRSIDATNIDLGRINHWANMLPALSDFSFWGAGLGTYSLISPAYETSDKWFVNADNQFVEMLLELGWIGTFIPVLILAFLIAWIRFGLANPSREITTSASSSMLIFLVSSQACHSVFDFGISLLANMLASSVLTGIALSQFLKESERESNSAWLSNALIPASLILVALAATACIYWTNGTFEKLQIVLRPSSSQTISQDSTNDSELADTVKNLHAEIEHIELELAQLELIELIQKSAKRDPKIHLLDLMNWCLQNKSLEEYVRANWASQNTDRLNELRSQIERELRIFPLDSDLRTSFASITWLASSSDEDRRRQIQASTTLRPTSFSRRLPSAILDAKLGDSQSTLQLFKSFPDKVQLTFDSAKETLGLNAVAKMLFEEAPSRLEQLFDATKAPEDRLQLAIAVEPLLDISKTSDFERSYLSARTLQTLGRFVEAKPFFDTAIKAQPLNVETRVHAIENLIRTGDGSQAAQLLESSRRIAPNDPRLKIK